MIHEEEGVCNDGDAAYCYHAYVQQHNYSFLLMLTSNYHLYLFSENALQSFWFLFCENSVSLCFSILSPPSC